MADSNATTPKVSQLPRGTMARVALGSSFAEYDKALAKAGAFVETPAIKAASDPSHGKCFFVGRRGTGKTAIALYLLQKYERTTVHLLPQIFASLADHFRNKRLKDIRQRQFKSLIVCFKRAIQGEVIRHWIQRGLFSLDRTVSPITKERNLIEDSDFDSRLSTLVEHVFELLAIHDDRGWLREVNRAKEVGAAIDEAREDRRWDSTVIIDRIDEAWDGSDDAVVLLAALMHACVELTATSACIRPLLFVRENMFERVRDIDTEFARLETSIISLDWSRELLLELIERRLNLALTAKLPLHGPTWGAFFEEVEGHSSQDFVFDYCHDRPRDVLIYCSLAVESAQSHRHHRILIEDLLSARRRFSEGRLKDLGDEYAENYPQLQLVLARFFGLGREFTINGVTDFIKKLLVDEEIKAYCGQWVFKFTAPDRFIQLLYDIGFVGLREGDTVHYRSTGPESTTPPPIRSGAVIVVHPSYIDALHLQNVVVGSLQDSVELRISGVLLDLPEAINLQEYQKRLADLLDELKALPRGEAYAARYEEIVGSVIKLCFFKSLSNVKPHERDVHGRVVRDWIAANHATGGFWELVRLRYQATQIVWECKNFDGLDSGAFHQAAYYMTQQIGRFAVIAFRGEMKPHYYDHIRRVSTEKDGGLVLPLTDRDLAVFIRQALKGKMREEHLQEVFDRTVRMIS